MSAERIQIPVDLLEFDTNGNTLWVHYRGATILRIKCKGFSVETCKSSPTSHADVFVNEKIKVCIAPRKSHKKGVV